MWGSDACKGDKQVCITPDSATYWKTLNFVDTTNGIKFTIDCLATAQSLGIEPKQFEHPQVQRVVKAADAIRNDPKLRVDLSMRATEEVCLLLEHKNFADFKGDVVAQLIRSSFCGRFPGRWDDPFELVLG